MADETKIQESAEKYKKDCEYFRTAAKAAAVIPFFGWAAAAALAGGAEACDKSMEDLARQNADLWANLQNPEVKARYDKRLIDERALIARGKPVPPQVILDATAEQKKGYDKAYAAYKVALKGWQEKNAPPLVPPDEWKALHIWDRQKWDEWVTNYANGQKAIKKPWSFGKVALWAGLGGLAVAGLVASLPKDSPNE